ncbi:MAG: DNA repair protein RadA [Alphaproteobacteria bacterium]|nr:DNA repair protein RadA [Alphaproteobacteria bacterium]
MAKSKTQYICAECGQASPKWFGQCPSCRAWNSFEEEVQPSSSAAKSIAPRGQSRALPISQIGAGQGEVRLRTGIGELDRVLGGGLVTGSLTLVGGDPGVGKSTLLLMVLERFAARGVTTLYVSAEESARQVRLRAERLGVQGDSLYLLAETDLSLALEAVDQVKPRVLVLDSVQTLCAPDQGRVPGSVSQVREVAARAMALAKSKDIPTFLVGHVTKQGGLAGPKVLEHLVDTVVYFEGDGRSQLRVVRATKNRFGATGELGFFEMADVGLREVPDASARLLAERVADASGTAVVAAMEGSRPVLAEVQALVGRPTPGNPSRTVLGLDKARLDMLLAVLSKLGLQVHDRDVFASAVGGMRLAEPAADLGLAAAIVGSLRDRALDPHVLVFGEIGLVGEVRAVGHPGPRLVEAARHGFKRAVVPSSAVRYAPDGLEVVGVRTLRDAITALF